MNFFRVRGDDDTTILGLSDVVIQCLGHHIERQSPLSQPLDELQPGHVSLHLRADLSVCFAARAIWHSLSSIARTIRSSISDHAFYPQIAFSIDALWRCPFSLRRDPTRRRQRC